LHRFFAGLGFSGICCALDLHQPIAGRAQFVVLFICWGQLTLSDEDPFGQSAEAKQAAERRG
jgi:hypothetical protein